MARKVNPISVRLDLNRSSDSSSGWFCVVGWVAFAIFFYIFNLNFIGLDLKYLLERVGFSLGSRALSFFLIKMGCWGDLALAIGFAVKAILANEAPPYLGNLMLPAGDAGASSSNPFPRWNVDLNLPPAPEPEPAPPAPRGPDEPGGAEREHPQGMEPVERALFRLDLERRKTLKEALARHLETRVANEYSVPPEGAPSPEASVEALIERWGDIFPKGQVYLDGNGPEPSQGGLKKLNAKLKHALNALSGQKDGPGFRQTLGQIDWVLTNLFGRGPR